MERIFLLCWLFVISMGAGIVSGEQPIDLNNNLSYLINSSMGLSNNTTVNIYINMPINVYVEKGDGFHILHIGDENLTTAIFNSTDTKKESGYEFKDVILSQGPFVNLNLTGNT